jgi:hypothetical protein
MPYQRDGNELVELAGVVMRRWMQSWVARLEVICGAAVLDAISSFISDRYRHFSGLERPTSRR